MRVAVIFFAVKNRIKLQEIAKGLCRGIEAQGHQVDLIDGFNEPEKKLTMYKYIALGTESTSIIGGHVSEKIALFLKNSGSVGGKRSFAFLTKSLFGVEKTLQNLMGVMEAEGMYLKNSEVFIDGDQAEVIGKELHINV